MMQKTSRKLFPLHPNRFINKLYNWDIRVLLRGYHLNLYHNSFIKKMLIFGDIPIWVLFSMILLIFGNIKSLEYMVEGGLLLFIGILISGITLIIPKVVVSRNRPYANMKIEKYYSITIENRDKEFGSKENESFPSGHVLLTFLALSVFTYAWGILGFVIFTLISFPMPFLRCNLGVHYPSDTIAGIILGILTGTISILFYNSISYPLYNDTLNFLKSSSGWIGYIFIGFLVFLILFLGKFRK